MRWLPVQIPIYWNTAIGQNPGALNLVKDQDRIGWPALLRVQPFLLAYMMEQTGEACIEAVKQGKGTVIFVRNAEHRKKLLAGDFSPVKYESEPVNAINLF